MCGMPTSTSSIHYPATSLNQTRSASLRGIVYHLRQPANLTGERHTRKRLTRCLLWVTGLLLSISQLAQAQVSGTVFRDFNANGVKDTYDVGVASVTVTAYTSAAASVVVSTTAGSYSFAAVTLPSGTPVRLEFTYPATTGDFNAPFSAAAAGNGTAVQFVTAGAAATNINFAVNLPNDYCQANPFIVLPCYQNGLRTNNTQAALVAFPYNASGQTGPETPNATIAQVGATWGTDYQVVQKRLFAGAFLKRHVDLGSQGTGGMYVLDYTASATAPAISSFNLQGVTPAVGPVIDLGSVNRTAAASGLAASNFQLSTASTTPNIDLDAFERAGNTSLGDVDLDQTEKTLWAVNLNQRSLITMDVSGATLPGAVNHHPLGTLPGYPTPATYTNTGTTTLRINAGGGAFTDAAGNAWAADQNFTSGTTPLTAGAIKNLDNPYESTNGTQSLYQSVRAGSSFSYAVPVVNGRYRVVLHLSDFTSTAVGQRLTTTTAETFTALAGLDLWASRDDVANRATTSQFVVDVTDGTLNLAFTGGGTSNEARVAGVEIIPVPSGASGVMRPWGLGFRNGKGYLGVVSDGSNSLRRADLQAYILAFDPANIAAGFTTTLSFPLNFTRENVNGSNTPGQWTTWRTDITMQGDVRDLSYRRNSPQPLISDIDFSENGSMEIGFLDRSGIQEGFSNNVPYAGTSLLNGSGIRTAGDILHACFINGGFVLEQGNSGTVCKSNDAGGGTYELTNDGPANGGEFYYDDVYADVGTGQSLHMENATGGLLQRKGSGEVLTTVYDPTQNAPNNGLFSQGVHWYNNLTGAKADEFVVVSFTGNVGVSPYDPTGFGKAQGLGDPTMRCDAAPIEIGNRVWKDDNRNGIQDPTEAGIPNVTVTLYKNTTLVATATTNTDGEYYFSSGAGTNTAAAIYSLTALTPGSTVQLRINGAQTALSSLSLSPNNQGSNDAIDSDFAPGTPGSATAVADVTLGVVGQNVHTFDAGLFACPTIAFTAPASATTTVCANTTLNMSVSTNALAPDQIRFIYFNDPLASPTDAYTASGGTVLGTVASTSATGNKTVTLANAQLPDNQGNASRTIYVYAISVSTDGLCQPVAQRAIVLNPRPIPAISGDPQICQGSSATLTANGPTGMTFQWFLNNGTVAVTTVNPYITPVVSTTTTYRLRGTFNGCVSDDVQIVLTPVPCTPCVSGTGTIGGVVYRDFNGNGVNDTEPGMGAITVTIFRCDAGGSSTQVAQMPTDIKGQYSFTGLTGGTTYRVEFSNLPTGYEPTYKGTNNGTTTQFLLPGTCNASLGLNQPAEYCQPNPRMVTPCYIDGAVAPNTGTADVLVGFDYNVVGSSPTNKTIDATRTDIGSTWGLAYDKATKRMYVSAFLKRHVGLKDSKLGQIYVKDYNNPSAAPVAWLDVSTLPGIAGNWTYLTDAQRGLGNAGLPTLDADAFAKIAQVGLGDIDISDDNKTLYVMDLLNRQLLAIDIATKTLIGKYPIPDVCSGTAGPVYFTASSKPFTATDGKIWNKGIVFNTDNSALEYGQTINNPNSVTAGTTDAALYATSVYTTGTLGYAFPMGNGSYGVKMHFATNLSITNRNTSVQVESTTAISGLDVYAASGNQVNYGLTRSFTATVTDGVLSISVINGAGSSYAAVSGFEITPLSGQAKGVTRPFATKYRNGKVYVGAVCDASFSQNRDDLRASVFAFDPTAGSFTPAPVLTFPLTYLRGASYGAAKTGSNNRWEPWTSVYPNNTGIGIYYGGFDVYTQPVLSDIEFDVDGSMLLGFFDRFPNQIGAAPNYRPDRPTTAGLTSSYGVVGGDILRAYFNGSSFELESNAKEGVSSAKAPTAGANGLQGPGGGEFYFGDAIPDVHNETSMGGLALLPGSGEVRVTSGDPLALGSGGILTLSNTTGAKIVANSFTLYAGGGGGVQYKANGLGDLELLCNLAPIQIGNRVWRDDNRNGIQDPCEPAIPGAVVKLYNAAKTTVLASVTTNAAGEYYFASTTITTGNSTSSVSTSLLTYNTTYGLVITSLGTGTAVTGLTLTDVSPVTPGESGTLNSGLTINNNDAKVDVVGGIPSPCIKLTTGGPGSTNHTYDFGIVKFVCSLTATASASSQTVCAGQSVTLTTQATPVGSYTYTVTGPGGVTLSAGTSATTVATNLTAGVNTFTVTVSSSPGCSTTATASVTVAPLPTVTLTSATVCAGQSASLTASGAGVGAAYVFSTSGAIGNVLTVLPTMTTVYTVTATTTGGCSATATGTVTVNPLPNAGPDQVLVCGPLGTPPVSPVLTATPAGGIWTNAALNPSTATFTPNAAVTTVGNLVAGTYTFNYTVNGCTDAVVVTVPVCQTFCATITATANASSSTLTPGQSVTLTASVSPAGSYTYAWSGPGGTTITPTNASAVTASGLSNGVNTFTVTVTSSPGCFTTATVSVTVLTPALSVSVATPVCNTLTNNYTASGTVSLTNAQAGSLTITDNGTLIATIAVTTGQTSATFSTTGVSGSSPASHSVVATLGTTTASTTYATPASCTVCSLSLTTTALNNGQVGTAYSQTLTTTGGTAPLSFSLSGSLPTGLILNANTGVIAGTPTSATTASFSVLVTDAKACTAIQSLSIVVSNAPVCSLTVTATPGVCNPATNQYSVTGTVSATNVVVNNASPQTLTISAGGQTTTTTLTGNGPASYTLTGLTSDGLVKTLTVMSSATVCGMASTTFTAPVSCTPVLSVVVGTPVCNTLTNNYTASGTVSLTNAQAGSLTITDNGTLIATIAVTTGQTTAAFTATGVSGSSPASHSVVATLGTTTASTTYATPASCTVCSLSITTTALNNGQVGTPYSQTLTTTGGTAPLSFALTGSLPTGLTLDANTGVIAGTPTSATTASFSVLVTDGKSCSALVPLTITVGNAPVCSLTATVTPGVCNTATNQYSVTGTISATNTPANQSLTVAVGSHSVLVALNGNGPVSFTLAGLDSDGLMKTLTVMSSATACGMTSVTYAAPASCTVDIALSVTPGTCSTATNQYGITGTLSLTNAIAGTATITDGTSSTTVAISAGNTSVPYSLTGLPSGTGEHIVTVSYAGKIASMTYTAPESCTVAPMLALTVTPGVCNSATNQYDLMGTVSLTAAVASTLTISDGASSTMVSVTAGQTSVDFSLTSFTSGTGEHIVTVSGTGYAPVSATYNAPESCTVCSLSITTSSLPNGQVGTAYSQTLTTTGGTAPLTFAVAGGSLPAGLGLNTATGVITGTPISAATVSFSISVTDGKSCSALVPLSITIGSVPVCSLTATATPGVCNSATNQYDLTGTVSATNATGSQSLTIAVGSEASTVVTLTGNGPVSYTLSGLQSGTAVKTVTVLSSATACGTASTTYTAPASCTVAPQLASLGDKVFRDNNANGLQDPTIDTPLPGVTVTLISNGTVVATTTTASSGTGIGCYSFTGLTPGVPYSVSFTTPVGFSATTPLSGTDKSVDSDPVNGITAPVTLTAGENNITIDAGFVPLKASLGDFVWYDTNGNGQQDPGEAGVPGITVKLYNPLSSTVTPIASLTTNSQGKYLFTDLNAGVYCVIFDKTTLPTGFSLTTANVGPDATDSDADPITGKTGNYTLAAGDQELTVDAGIVPVVVPTGSIGDFVWKDNNNNGQFDTNEPPVPGVQVQLFTVSGGITSPSALQTTVTDGNGQYTFANLPSGDYRVKFTVPASLTGACQLTNKLLSGTDKTRDSDADPTTGFSPIVTINASGTGIVKDNPTIDAGLQRRIYDPVGYIYCYKDGTILKGGTISVTGPGNITITQDGSKGYYQFFTDGTPGSYMLSYNNPNAYGIATGVRPPAGPFIVPTGLEGTPTDKDGILNGWVRLGSDVNADSTALLDASAVQNPYYLVFNVKPGDPYVSENNLPIECTPPPLGSIGDFVFNDLNKDGRQDSGEPGVNGVTVRLLEQTSPNNFTLVSTTATTGNGAYLFPNLPAGTYVVEFDKTTLPTSLTFTTPNATGVPTNLDSDAIPTAGNPMVARSAPVTLVPTDPTRRNDLTIDAGLFDTTCPPAKCVPIVIQQIRGPRR